MEDFDWLITEPGEVITELEDEACFFPLESSEVVRQLVVFEVDAIEDEAIGKQLVTSFMCDGVWGVGMLC